MSDYQEAQAFAFWCSHDEDEPAEQSEEQATWLAEQEQDDEEF